MNNHPLFSGSTWRVARPIALAIAVALAALSAVGCACPRGAGVGPGGCIRFMSASAVPAADVTQELQLSHDGGPVSFLLQSEIDADAVVLVGLTPTANRAFDLRWDGATFSAAQSPMITETLPLKRLFGLYQFAHWPLAEVQAASSGRVSEAQVDGQRIRTLRIWGWPRLTAVYDAPTWTGNVEVRYPGGALHFRTLDRELRPINGSAPE